MAFNEDSSSGHDEPWIQWFCGLKGHEMFCEVERSYIEDGFNLYGLRACVSNFSDCLDLILDRIGPDEDSDDSHLTQSACTLYGLIHARYILTAHGLDAMYGKYAAKEFGTCPLVQCSGQPVLPVSLKDEMGADTVKIYCPKCSRVYHPPPHRMRSSSSSSSSAAAAAVAASHVATGSVGPGGAGAGAGTSANSTGVNATSAGPTSGGVDGAAFGTTFPHLFLMTFSNLVPDPLPIESAYIPRVFGFRVHKSARQRFNHSTSGITSTTVQPATTIATIPSGSNTASLSLGTIQQSEPIQDPTKVSTIIDSTTTQQQQQERYDTNIVQKGNDKSDDDDDDDDSQSAPAIGTTSIGYSIMGDGSANVITGITATPALNDDEDVNDNAGAAFDDDDDNNDDDVNDNDAHQVGQSSKRSRKTANGDDEEMKDDDDDNDEDDAIVLMETTIEAKRRRKKQ